MTIILGLITAALAENNPVDLPFRLAGFAEAKPYKSISLPECQAEIPEDVVLPPYQPALGYYEYLRAADGSTITQIFYFDLRFKYYNKDWEEIAPYVEFVKWEKGIPHLIGLAYVNEDCNFWLFADENNDTELRAVDRLIRVREPTPLIKRAPASKIGVKDKRVTEGAMNWEGEDRR
jgi:hypothetical protein